MKLVVMRDKGFGRGTAIDRLEDGCFHLQKALVVKIFTQGADDGGARAEEVAHFRVGDQIHITTAIARFAVAHTMPLVGHWLERLAQELDRGGINAHLTRLGDGQFAGRADKVAEVDELLPNVVVKALWKIVAAQQRVGCCRYHLRYWQS